MPLYIEKINGDVNRPTNRQGEYRAICLFRKLDNRKKAEICNLHHTQNVTVAPCTHIMHARLQPGTCNNTSDTCLIRSNTYTYISYFIVLIWVRPVQNDCYPTTRERKHLYSSNSPLHPCTLHNVYFVKYDVTVSFLAQVLDTVTYFVSYVLDSGCSDIFWHIF